MGTESGVGTGLWVQVGVLACCTLVLGGEQMVGAAGNEHPPTLLPSLGCLSPCLWLKSARVPPPPSIPHLPPPHRIRKEGRVWRLGSQHFTLDAPSATGCVISGKSLNFSELPPWVSSGANYTCLSGFS